MPNSSLEMVKEDEHGDYVDDKEKYFNSISCHTVGVHLARNY